ncbi:MAG: homoserine O-acetyltransferase [Acidobacteria bacterium]|nr:homoserine O-acetyltransferase [Acidobacteriota bacterium]
MTDQINPTFEGDYFYDREEEFALASGQSIKSVRLHYAIYGELNDDCDNAVLVCHALSGSARVADWWPRMFGDAGVFDLDRDCVICLNVIGSCYGSTGPHDINPATARPFGADFPVVSVRDWVRSQALLLDHLGIDKLRAVIGASIGGMQSIQWAIDYPERLERCIAIGAAPLNAMALGLNHLQRKAIMNDPHWLNGQYYSDEPPKDGLAMARAIAMCTYKSSELFAERYHRKPNRNGEDPYKSLDARYDVGGYLDYQGDIFTGRFDANSYLMITKAMDNFDPACGYASEAEALARIKAPMLLVGISSDWLFPASDVQALSTRMIAAGAMVEYDEIVSNHGHDGFLAEPASLTPLITQFLSAGGSDRNGAFPAQSPIKQNPSCSNP